MNTSIFSSLTVVLGGLFIGFCFGIFLQKGSVTNSKTIKNQLLLKDFTVMKIILSAIATGSTGIYGYRFLFEAKPLILSSTTLFAALTGGGVFGIGMALLGYCPGTCIGALAEKSEQAKYGFIGMVLGALIYANISNYVTLYLKPIASINKTTLVEIFDISPFYFIAVVIIILFLLRKMSFFSRN